MNKTTDTNRNIICRTGLLTDRQIQDIRQLIRHCQQTDNTSLYYPFHEEDCHHYLLYENTEDSALCAVLAMIPCETEAECSAFTRPDKRRLGYFTELLETALETFEEYDILFPITGSCPDTLAALEALGAEVESTELMMELDLDEWEEDSRDLSGFRAAGSDRIRLEKNISEDGDLNACTWSLYSTASDDRTLLGTCRTTSASDSCACLHHVEILPQFRRKGCGTVMLIQLLSALRESGVSRVILQVSGSNEAALALYRKQGFRITETLSYYLY